jgi:hypothetical protein
VSDGQGESTPYPVTFGEWIKTPAAMEQMREELLARMAPDYQPSPVERAFQEAARELVRVHLRNVEAYPVLEPYLARTGWFLPGNFPASDVGYLADLVQNGHPAEASAIIAAFARLEIDRIEAELIRNWPKRAHLLREAFAIHREARYALSIPVLLAQADGIAFEVLGVQLFGKDSTGAPRTRAAYRANLEPSADPTRHPWAMIFGPLEMVCSWRERTDIWRMATESDPHHGTLNRHGVLHGTDLEYPTEENSLRAILMLDYVDGVRTWLREER